MVIVLAVIGFGSHSTNNYIIVSDVALRQILDQKLKIVKGFSSDGVEPFFCCSRGRVVNREYVPRSSSNSYSFLPIAEWWLALASRMRRQHGRFLRSALCSVRAGKKAHAVGGLNL